MNLINMEKLSFILFCLAFGLFSNSYASVLASVKEDQYKYKGLEVPKDEIAQLKKEILAKYDYEGSAFYSTARLWDDGIIDPVDTRKILALGIAASLNQPFPPQQFGVFRM